VRAGRGTMRDRPLFVLVPVLIRPRSRSTCFHVRPNNSSRRRPVSIATMMASRQQVHLPACVPFLLRKLAGEAAAISRVSSSTDR